MLSQQQKRAAAEATNRKEQPEEAKVKDADEVEKRRGVVIDTPPVAAASKASEERGGRISGSNDDRLRRKLEELTLEMRQKFQGATRSAASCGTNERNPQVTSVAERVRKDIAEAKRVIAPPPSTVVSAQVSQPPPPSLQAAKNHQAAIQPSEPIPKVSKQPPPPAPQPTPQLSGAHNGADLAKDDGDEVSDIPVRDPSSRSQDTDKLRLKVSEIFARHQSDLEAVRNANLGIELPEQLDRRREEQQLMLLKTFSASRNMRSNGAPAASAPVAVPWPNATLVESDGRHSPHRLHRADTPSDDPDQFNFIATARRKLREQEREQQRLGQIQQRHEAEVHRAQSSDHANATLSEGPLSTSIASSAGAMAQKAHVPTATKAPEGPTDMREPTDPPPNAPGRKKKTKRRTAGTSKRHSESSKSKDPVAAEKASNGQLESNSVRSFCM